MRLAKEAARTKHAQRTPAQKKMLCCVFFARGECQKAAYQCEYSHLQADVDGFRHREKKKAEKKKASGGGGAKAVAAVAAATGEVVSAKAQDLVRPSSGSVGARVAKLLIGAVTTCYQSLIEPGIVPSLPEIPPMPLLDVDDGAGMDTLKRALGDLGGS